MQKYKTLQLHYESCLENFGPTANGMDWPNLSDLKKRFKVLTSIADHDSTGSSLLDLGCGAGLLIDYLRENQILDSFNYYGVDISPKMVKAAEDLHPKNTFEVRDIITNPFPDNQFDYVVMNGVLTEKQNMTQAEMINFAQEILLSAFKSCRKGVAFNVMSSHVDWKRDDLFHWELDKVVSFLVKKCSRNIRIFMDYGLYEYTIHLKKQ